VEGGKSGLGGHPRESILSATFAYRFPPQEKGSDRQYTNGCCGAVFRAMPIRKFAVRDADFFVPVPGDE
jgi:hypothetical protein